MLSNALGFWRNRTNKPASRNYFTISIHSSIRDKKFEKKMIKEMRKNIYYVWYDKSIPFRVKVSSTVISIFPYLFKVRK